VHGEVRYVEVARASSGRGEVVLRRRVEGVEGGEDAAPTVLELRVNGVFVMDSAENASEVAMARVALERCPDPRHVLVGGLGLGFTTHEVLSDHRVERVVVAEIEEALVRWFRDGTIHHGAPYLADQRLRLHVGDVQQVVAESRPASFDLVLLDVDNGPSFLVHQENAAIYEPAFLRQAHDVLRPGGVLVVWSSTDDEALTTAVREVFGSCSVEEHPVRLQQRDDAYWLHVAQKS
jgi:spermidine synthase